MSDTQLTTADLVQQCIDANAASAAETLSALLGPKLVDAIQSKKVEVAQSMYGAPTQQQDDTSSEEDPQTATADQTEEEDENA